MAKPWNRKSYVYDQPVPGREAHYIYNGDDVYYFAGFVDMQALRAAEANRAASIEARALKKAARERMRESDLKIQAQANKAYRETISAQKADGVPWSEAHRIALAEADKVRRELQRKRRAEKNNN